MIVWLTSYPKSGNTLVRSMLSAYFFSEDGKFQFNQLGHSSQFEKRDRLNLINKINKDDFLNLDKLKTLSKYWLILQKKENMKINFVPTELTHSIFQKYLDIVNIRNEQENEGLFKNIRNDTEEDKKWNKHSGIEFKNGIIYVKEKQMLLTASKNIIDKVDFIFL